jgi:glycosyltransferase involved in cell wall biosynthesis
MKLIVQIPCFNEAATLPATVAAIPRAVPGFDRVELLVIDDGSTDGTGQVARAVGVDHVLRLTHNQGLARAFSRGVAHAVGLGADVIVNTDADNQYRAEDVAALVRPITAGAADLVVGARPLNANPYFSRAKRWLQLVGSGVVRAVSGTPVADATSGFRAMTRDAALRLCVFGGFTYTLETVIQAGLNNLRVVSVPVRVNPPTRPSRLFRSNAGYVLRSVKTIACVYAIYRPAWSFGLLSAVFLALGVGLGVRYLVLALLGEGAGHVQSVVACSILLTGGLFLAAVGVIAYLQGINRQLLQEIRYLALSRGPDGPRTISPGESRAREAGGHAYDGAPWPGVAHDPPLQPVAALGETRL